MLWVLWGLEMSCVEQVAPNDPPTEPGAALGMAQVARRRSGCMVGAELAPAQGGYWGGEHAALIFTHGLKRSLKRSWGTQDMPAPVRDSARQLQPVLLRLTQAH